MVAYTEYVRDPRVRRYAESLVRHGYIVDCFVLKESGKLNHEEVNGVSLHHLDIFQATLDKTRRKILTADNHLLE